MDDESLMREDEPRNFLLVEGVDDVHVFKSLLAYYHIHYVFRGRPEYDQIPKGLIEIIDTEGIDNLLERLEAELITSGNRRLGIVVDADDNLAGRWQSLRDKLTVAGYNSVPNNPESRGTVIKQDGRHTVGVWIMPDNNFPGRLEDFVRFLVPSSDLLWPIAEDSLQRVIVKERRFPLEHKSKALIHTWLAWQKIPGRPMGVAITARYFDATAPHAQQLIDWARRLFEKAYENFLANTSVEDLLAAVKSIATSVENGKSNAAGNASELESKTPMKREDLKLICFDYVWA